MSVLTGKTIAWIVCGCLAAPAVASALICETLGATATQFDYVLSQKLVAKPRSAPGGYYGYGCSPWGFVSTGWTCSPLAKFAASEVAEVTATRQTGTAVRFRDGGVYPCTSSYVENVYTGGGRVRLPESIEVEFVNVDTTGMHPSLAACSDAMQAMSAASAAFAAMAPVQTFGKVAVEQGEERVIDATGGGVINMDKLSLEGVPIRPYYGYRFGTCAYNYYGLGGFAALRIEGNPSDEVVINVRELTIGACAEIDSPVRTVLINVWGGGRKIRIGTSALVAYGASAHILAPERVVSIRGPGTESSTLIGSIYARRLVTLGFVDQFDGLFCP